MEQQQESELNEIELVRSNHDEAYMYISQGLSYYEQGQHILAKEMFTKGINKMEKALEVRCDKPHCIGERWDKIREMQHKMRRTLLEVRSHLSKLDSRPTPSVPPRPHHHDLDRPPSYEEACGHQSPLTSNSMHFVDECSRKDKNGNDECLAKGKDLLQGEATSMQPNGQSMGAEELFYLQDGAQIFYISPEGYVSAPSYPSSLHIYKFIDSATATLRNSPQAWLQVGSWMYPLDPGKSPVLHSGFGAYVFPDVAANQVGAAVGLILPSDVDQSVLDTFEALMVELTAIKAEKPPWPKREEIDDSDRMSNKISQGIITGAEILSQGLNKGAEITGELMKKGAAKIREKVSPVDRPLPVDPKLRQGIAIARSVSGTVLTVSGYVVSKLGKLTVSLGNQLAPHIRKQGEKAFQSVFQTDTVDSKRKMDDVMIVAAGGLTGFSTVYMGLENAARSLASCLATETVQVVNHTYGQDVSGVVDNALNTIGNVALATHNVRALGVKGVAKRTAKDTGRALLEDYIQSEHQAPNSKNGNNNTGSGNAKYEASYSMDKN